MIGLHELIGKTTHLEEKYTLLVVTVTVVVSAW